MGSGLYTYLLSIRSRSGSFLIISMTSAMTSGTTFRSSTALSRSLMEEGLQRGAHNHCLNNRLPSIVNMQAYSNCWCLLVWLQWLFACNITLWTYQMEWRTGSVETTEFLPVTRRGRPRQGFSRSVHPVPEQLKRVMLDTWGQSIVDNL